MSLDYLMKSWVEAGCGLPSRRQGVPRPDTARLEEQMEDLARYFRGYAYTSRTRIGGVPLVSIRFSRRGLGREGVARGIIAVGNAAVGVVAIGAVSLGIFSFGALSLGVLAVGAGAVGVVSLGALAVGAAAFGSCAIGVYAAGVAAVGRKIAVGAAAAAETAVGQEAVGQHTLLWGSGLGREEVEAFLLTQHPGLWRPLLRALSFFGGHIQ